MKTPIGPWPEKSEEKRRQEDKSRKENPEAHEWPVLAVSCLIMVLLYTVVYLLFKGNLS